MLAERPQPNTIKLERPKYGARIKVLVVDDSSFMRNHLTSRLDGFRRINVVGSARDGYEALDLIKEHKPDIVTLDIQMPRLNGLETLERIMRESPTRILMLSSLTIANAEATIEALHCGAIDVIAKPKASRLITEDFIHEIVDKIEAVATQPLRVPVANRKARSPRARTSESLPFGDARHLVVIGSSTGGPAALNEILPELPSDLDVAYLIVQHMPPNFTRSLAQRLNRSSGLLVKEAESGDPLRTGMALLAPGGFHMLLDKQRRIVLTRDHTVNGVRPAVDVTMEQIAPTFGKRACGVVLTGMGVDGRRGARHIRRHDGFVIVQDEGTSVVYGMPGSVARAGYANIEAPLQDIPNEIVRWRNSVS
ncbi:MAG: chemotaxis response regulator protein-glutamate methylesterase [Thermomicrobiales bacterium]